MTLDPDRRLRFVEERRKAAEALLWQVPSVSIAAQAFLLGAGLDPNASGWARILVGLLGMVAMVATGAVVASQSVRVTVLTRWVNHHQDDPVRAHELNDDLATYNDAKNPPLNGLERRLLDRNPLGPWAAVLVAFLITDLVVVIEGLRTL
jgi:hypothetical protein